MRVRTLCTIKRGGVYHPPGATFDDLDEADLKALRGRVEVLPDLGEAPAALSPSDEGEGAPPTGDAPPVDLAAEAAEPAPSLPAPGPAAESEGAGTPASEGDSRVGEIARAIDTLDPAEFTQAGRPKVDALEAALGYRPSREEVDAAVALNDSMNG